MDEQQNIIIYRTADGRASVALFAKDGKIWLNQQQMAELFATSKPNISMHIANILKLQRGILLIGDDYSRRISCARCSRHSVQAVGHRASDGISGERIYDG